MPNPPTNADLARAIEQVHSCVEQKFSEMNRAAWKILGTIGGILFTGFVSVLVAIFINGMQTQKQTQQISDTVATHTQLRYTSDDAAADKAHQADIDADLAAQIAALKAKHR